MYVTLFCGLRFCFLVGLFGKSFAFFYSAKVAKQRQRRKKLSSCRCFVLLFSGARLRRAAVCSSQKPPLIKESVVYAVFDGGGHNSADIVKHGFFGVCGANEFKVAVFYRFKVKRKVF